MSSGSKWSICLFDNGAFTTPQPSRWLTVAAIRCLGCLIRYSLITVLMILLFAPVVSNMVMLPLDYGGHLRFASQLVAGMSFDHFMTMVPHFLYHLSTALVYTFMLGVNIVNAGALVALFAYSGTGLVIYSFYVHYLRVQHSYRNYLIGVATVVMAAIVMPISLFTPNNFFFGYVSMNTYHSPTYTFLKPFALALVFVIGRMLSNRPLKYPPVWGVAVGLLSIAATAAKPSFTIALLPALAAIIIHRRFQGKNNWLLLTAVFLPAAMLLGLQFARYTWLRNSALCGSKSLDGILPSEFTSRPASQVFIVDLISTGCNGLLLGEGWR